MAELDERCVGADLHLVVAGRIDADFAGATEAAPGSRVVVHLGDVTGISSVGVRAFERFLASYAHTQLVLIHVAPSVAMQLNLLGTLPAHVEVQSARLPFLCHVCGRETVAAVPWRSGAHERYAPECLCGRPMDLDGLAQHYLPAVSADDAVVLRA
jgi:anti-anti-sigma regulatory factor